MSTINQLSDADLRSELINLGFKAGPVTGTTRKLYEKKLESLQKGIKTKNSKRNLPKSNEKKSISSISSFTSFKKENESQIADTESSDNELNLTLSSINSSTTNNFDLNSINQKTNTKLQNQNTTSLNFNLNQFNAKSINERTPTPPRLTNSITSNNKIQPVINPNENFLCQKFINTNDSNNSVYKQDYSANSSLINSNFEDDDHTETSRIISHDQRFDPFRNSVRSNYYNSKNIDNVSSIEKIRRISKGAWNLFSRSINSSTSCVDKNLQTDRYFSPSKVQRFSTKYSSQKKNSLTESCDISGWILVIGGSFLFVLGIAYFFTAHPKTVENGKIILQSAFSESFKLFYTYAILPLVTVFFVFLVAFGGYRLHKYQKCKKINKKNRLMLLVDRITDIIRDSNSEGISELHVRDIIMPPTKRSAEDWKLWKEAANFINLEDSRVRTEVRLVDGDECNIWVWVPLTNQKWQGTAVGENSLSNSLPNKALARCIKLRGIDFTDRQNEKSELRNELLRKLSPIVPVHMEFVTGAENIVYLMLKDLDDSKKAFCAFHSHWFNGNLISAKYVRDERYFERFPKLLSE